jgi:hypothetical protein
MSIFVEDDEELEELDPKAKRVVSIEFNIETLNIIDTKRGIVKRGPYLRQIILKNLDNAPTYPSEE